jgi:ankyrin repeat protein
MLPMELAAANDNVRMLDLLYRHGGQVNPKLTEGGYSPLAAAAEESALASLNWLIAHGADIQAQGERAIFEALDRCRVAPIEILMRADAKVGADARLRLTEDAKAYGCPSRVLLLLKP